MTRLELGCLCPSISEQLDKVGIKYDSEIIRKHELQHQTLNRLKFDDLFQPNHIDKAYTRLSKKVFEHIHTIANATSGD